MLATQISSGFLLLVVIYNLGYLWRRSGYRWGWVPINPHVVLLALLATVGLTGVFTLAIGIEFAILSAALGGGIVISFFHPVTAVSFFVAALTIRPWELIDPNQLLLVLPRLLAGIAVVAWAVSALKHGKLSISWNRSCTLFICVVVWLLGSALWSGDIDQGLDFHTSTFFPIVVFFFLIMNTVTDHLDLSALRGTVVISLVGLIATAVYVTVTDPANADGVVRLYGTGLWGNSNDLASLIVLVAPFVVFPRPMGVLTKKRLLVSLATGGLLMYALWISQSRGAFLAIAVAGAAYFVFCLRVRKETIFGLAVLLLIAGLMFTSIDRDEGDLQMSSDSRWNYLVVGLRMVAKHPLFGVGIDNYPRQYENYTAVWHEWGQQTAHSSWILVMAEAGVMGLFLFVGMYLSILMGAWKYRDRYPEYLLAMIGYGVAISFLSHTYVLSLYLLLAFVVGATKVYSKYPNRPDHEVSVKPFTGVKDYREKELYTPRKWKCPV